MPGEMPGHEGRGGGGGDVRMCEFRIDRYITSFLFTVAFEWSIFLEMGPEIPAPNIWRTASAECSTVMIER